MAGTKVSALSAVSAIKKTDTAEFLVRTADGSRKISFASLGMSLSKAKYGEYPYDDAVELSYSWADIDAMARANNFQDIRIGDYKTITAGGETVRCQVAGINTHRHCSDRDQGPHIDFISKDCLKNTVQWSSAGHNNGDANTPYPWLASTVFTYLNETILPKLPSDLASVIVNRRALMEQRYTAGATNMTQSNTWGWCDIGKLWLPNEVEVYGVCVWSGLNDGWAHGDGTHYPIFQGGWATRVKGLGHNGGRCSWWLRAVRSASSTHACGVGGYGGPHSWYVTDSSAVPLCFRIA